MLNFGDEIFELGGLQSRQDEPVFRRYHNCSIQASRGCKMRFYISVRLVVSGMRNTVLRVDRV